MSKVGKKTKSKGKCQRPFLWSNSLGRCVDTRQKKGRKKEWHEPKGDNPNKKQGG